MRLLTRSDFDGLGCAVLLKEAGVIDDIKFVHPKDVQDGKIAVDENDVLANVPYVKGCGLWFDHHSSENERGEYGDFKGACVPSAPSAARVIYDYYGGAGKFSSVHFTALVSAVDKADSADFTVDEILEPKGWCLLSFIMDPRTGLGRYKDYRISNYQLMMDLIGYCRTRTIDEILALEDVQERVRRYFKQEEQFQEMLKDTAVIRENVVVADLRGQDEIYTGNRFVLYAWFPDQNISVQIMWGLNKQNVVVTCGHSIINRTCRTDVGSLMLKYGGGGHHKVGTCQLPIESADKSIEAIISRIIADDKV
jgi:nanoRNase/pAp phosphatase (c-di-AMP/oligoRNAs hydrolase)